MSEVTKKCVLVGPGHNLPPKIRLGKLRRTKLDNARLEYVGGNRFLLHQYCLRFGCGQCYLASLDMEAELDRIFNPLAEPNYPKEQTYWRRNCNCSEFTSHDADSIVNALSAGEGDDIYEVRVRNFRGRFLYFSKTKKYFWLPDWFSADGKKCCEYKVTNSPDDNSNSFSLEAKS